MASGSSSSGNADSKRQRVLPVPKGVADVKTFTPDSSIASDVIPSVNFGDRAGDRQPDMILLHYTGMPDVEGAIAQLCTAGTEVSAHYIVLEDGRIVVELGRRDRRIDRCVGPSEEGGDRVVVQRGGPPQLLVAPIGGAGLVEPGKGSTLGAVRVHLPAQSGVVGGPERHDADRAPPDRCGEP